MTRSLDSSMKIIIAISIIALVIRLTAGLTVGWNRMMHLADQPLYDAFAKNILAGKGFQIPDIYHLEPRKRTIQEEVKRLGYFGVVIPNRRTAFFPPVYPVVLAASYGLFGPYPGSARIVQSLFLVNAKQGTK